MGFQNSNCPYKTYGYGIYTVMRIVILEVYTNIPQLTSEI